MRESIPSIAKVRCVRKTHLAGAGATDAYSVSTSIGGATDIGSA